jgi:tellurite resistance protein
MLFQLRNLSPAEQEIMLKAPVWTAILIAAADGEISEKELERLKDVVHIKTFSEHNDVENLYEELEASLEETINSVLSNIEGQGEGRIKFLVSNLEKLNQVLPKLNPTYAKQFVKSLRSLAVSIANSSGGVLGIGTISWEEARYIDLPMIQM